MNDVSKKFGENLKRIRKKRGFSRAQIAKIVGIDENSIGAYERGNREPNISRLIQLTEILGVSVGELVEDSQKTKKKIIDTYRLKRALIVVKDAGYLPTIANTDFSTVDLDQIQFEDVFNFEKIDDVPDYRTVVQLSYAQVDRQSYTDSLKKSNEIKDEDIKIELNHKLFFGPESFVNFVELVEDYAFSHNISFRQAFKKALEDKRI